MNITTVFLGGSLLLRSPVILIVVAHSIWGVWCRRGWRLNPPHLIIQRFHATEKGKNVFLGVGGMPIMATEGEPGIFWYMHCTSHDDATKKEQ
jgi:hypothetical protein